mmetsp:Transcript_8722/g.18248  ORF Transcript_8722/g.18248 Transcript_8722/m.18248 type:complete len:203 (-) Transcript_8722:1823-2431(-)
MLSSDDQSISDAGCISEGMAGGDANVCFVEGLVHAPMIVHHGSAMHHEFDGTIENRPAALSAICHYGKGGSIVPQSRSIVSAFFFFVNVDCCVHGVIIPCYRLEDRQVPGRAMVAFAFHKFPAIRIGVEGSIVIHHSVVSCNNFFSSAVAYWNGAHLVFDLDIGEAFSYACRGSNPRLFVLRMNFCSYGGMDHGCIGTPYFL